MRRCAPTNPVELDDQISQPDEAVIETVRQHRGDFVVLGAGGKMGFHLCLMIRRSLASLGRNDQVWAVSRFGTAGKSAEFESAGIRTVAVDLSSPNQLDQLPESENIFYLAGVKFGASGDSELLYKMNVKVPELVAQHFRRSRIVAFSTGCVYSFVTPESGGSTEESEQNPPGDYARSCIGRERAFFEAAKRNETRSALIRLNYSVDLRYGVLVDIARRVLASEAIDLSTGYVNVIWQGDAIRYSIRCLEHCSTPPFAINVTGAGVLSVRELAGALGSRLRRDPVLVGNEAPTAWLNNAAKCHRMFGPPGTSLETLLDMVAEWVGSGGELLEKPTRYEVRDGNY